ncbi:polysaccharide deacetylase family protein [Tissierella sp. Yu-01]|uniref:polysaccharide deacetylase family protein n=1 Tax=Tissierella sp. Yu-01 TaxID=3035694 RepID=UPI00240CFED0|nr:polysaccharide deacetylase family protein [Tissierella sp. Yu-01]WFA08550.1 polysaccharide deacetylase family protein [Tissierella sp. Yu-01]
MKRFKLVFLVIAILIIQIGSPVFSEEILDKPTNKIPVLTYHHILPREDITKYNWSNNSAVISFEEFKEQMDFLYNNGFYTATLDELQDFLNGKIQLPKKTVVITFDDGYLSNAIYAYPIMQQYNFRGTIFVIGSVANKEQLIFEPSTLQFISTNEMDKYTDVFDFECHTYDLHRMDKNHKPMLVSSGRKIIIDDLTKNKNLLNADYFAYPYGYYNRITISYLKESGYKMAFTTKNGYVTKFSNRYELPRFSVTPYMQIERLMEISLGNNL